MRSITICLALAAISGVAHAQTRAEVKRAYDHVHRTMAMTRGMKHSQLTLLVHYKDKVSEAEKGAVRKATGSLSLHRFRLIPNTEVLYVPAGAANMIETLRKNPRVLSVREDVIVKAADVPNDPFFNLQYGMNHAGNNDINAPQAWSTFTGTQNFPIAIIDSGIDLTHPELTSNLWQNPNEVLNGIDDDGNGYIDDINGYDFVHDDPIPEDELGHGTHVAGIIGAMGNNGVGVSGVNWSCGLMPLKFLNTMNEGLLSDAIRAIEYSVLAGAKVSNNSWYSPEYVQELYFAVGVTEYFGQVFCAAAGNSGIDLAENFFNFDPAEFPFNNVLAVASTNDTGFLSTFSNYGQKVDIAAPGSDVYSTLPGGSYGFLSGTSMATPHVAGAAALVYAQNPTWTVSQVVDRLLRTARPRTEFGTLIQGGRFLDVGAATTGPKPVVTITSPANALTVLQGAAVTFIATAVDPQDGNMPGGLVWLSNLQGQIGTGATFTKTNLVVGTHNIRAAAVDKSDLIGANSITITITPPPPATPGSVTAVKVSAGIARVNWADVANETNYEVQRETKSGSNWINQAVVGQVGANVTTITSNAGVNTFRFRVRAFNVAGTSGWSAWTAGVKL